MTRSKMAFWCTHRDGYSVIAFPAELAMAHMEEVREAGMQIIEQLGNSKAPACIVDLSALEYMGSSLVASIVRIWKAVRAQNGQMVVVASNEKIADVLKATGLAKVWTIVSTFEAAEHALGYSPEAKVEKRERRLLTFVGPLALLGAAVAVSARLIPQIVRLPSPPEWMIHLLGGLAFLAGGISCFREKSWKRGISIAVLLLSVTLLGIYVSKTFQWFQTTEPVAETDDGDTSSGTLEVVNIVDESAPEASDAATGAALPAGIMPPVHPGAAVGTNQPLIPEVATPGAETTPAVPQAAAKSDTDAPETKSEPETDRSAENPVRQNSVLPEPAAQPAPGPDATPQS